MEKRKKPTTNGKWTVDSVDMDPRYWSPGGIKYTATGGWATDVPGFPGTWKNTVMDFEFKLCIYACDDLPKNVTLSHVNGNPVGIITTKAIACVSWTAKAFTDGNGKRTNGKIK